MALIRSKSSVTEWSSYDLGDFEGQKQDFLKGIGSEAEGIVKKARQKAGDILKEAHHKGLVSAEDEAKRKREEGYQKGYEEGLAKGKEEALVTEKERIEQEWTPLVEQLFKVLERFEHLSSDLLKEAEQSLVKTSLDLAEQVIEVESRENEEVLQMRLKKALRILHVGMSLKIRLPDGMKARMEPLLTQWLAHDDVKTDVEWVEDPEMSDGEVVVSSDDAFVKFDSQMQWETLLKKLKLRELKEA
jgi:flagellar biosynthesis/type III secretory pathway protein FliH